MRRFLTAASAVILTVGCITILRAFSPLSGICGFLEVKWGRGAVIGLQAGIGAGVGLAVFFKTGIKR